MAVIWGLDLHDMQWSKFKSSYMFGNRDYHLRRTKFIVYQCAMIFLVVSESLGTAVLSDYIDQQDSLQGDFPHIDVFNNDYIGIASYNIFVGIFAAFVFGAGFFFDLFWPERHEPRGIRLAWQWCAITVCIAGLADALAYTVIVSLRSENVSNFDLQDPRLVAELNGQSSSTPILYRDSGRAVASVVLLWLGWAFAIVSTVVMIMFYRYLDRTGTSKSQSAIAKNGEKKMDRDSFAMESGTSKETPHPEPVTVADTGRSHPRYTISNPN